MEWYSFFLVLLASCLALPQVAFAAAGEPVRHDTAWQPTYALDVTAKDITINCKTRYSTVFNGSFPGPTLYLKEGETTWVRVYNNIKDANLTVHWHGLTQRTAPFSDGTPLVSQWPIHEGRFFDYELRPEIGDAGTYFYHSHVGFQAVTAQGLLIVRSADETANPYKYDDEFSLVFGDYYPEPDHVLEARLSANPFVWSGEPEALLMNGQSGSSSFDDASDNSCKPHVVTVKPGKTYRVRFVGGTGLYSVIAGIESHSELTIIEADGRWTKEAVTDHVQLGTGQRFSVLLKTKTEQELRAENRSSYWIQYDSHDRPKNVTAYGLLVYDTGEGDKTKPSELPTTSPVGLCHDQSEYVSWMEYTLEAHESLRKLEVDHETFPTRSEVSRVIHIQLNQKRLDKAFDQEAGREDWRLVWENNGLTWNDTQLGIDHFSPYMVQAYRNGRVPDYDKAMENCGWDPETRAFPARVGEVLEIVWVSNSGPSGGWDTHPLHAHGAHFWDLGSGNGTYDATANDEKFADGYVPARRDTTQLYQYLKSGTANTDLGWRAWRLRVTEKNVGAWMMHCHITPHAVMGMNTVWVFGDAEQIRSRVPEPYVAGYLEFNGSAYGNSSYDPLVAHYFAEGGGGDGGVAKSQVELREEGRVLGV